jgi:hypothetical protein
MRLALMVSFEIGSSQLTMGGRSEMNDWSSRTANRLGKQYADKSTIDATFLEEQRLKREFGPSLWREVVEEIKVNCEEPNKDMGAKVATLDFLSNEINALGTTAYGTNKLIARFNPGQSIIDWETKDSSGQFEVAIGPDGRPSFHQKTGVGLVPVSKSVAEHMLNALFQ